MARLARVVAPGLPYHVPKRRRRAPAKAKASAGPIGSDAFLAALEAKTRGRLHAVKRGPKPKERQANAAGSKVHCHRYGP